MTMKASVYSVLGTFPVYDGRDAIVGGRTERLADFETRAEAEAFAAEAAQAAAECGDGERYEVRLLDRRR